MPAHGEDEDQRADVCVCFHFLFLSSVSSFRFFFFYFYISIIYYVKEPKTENLFRIDQTNNGWLANGEWRMANDGFCGGGLCSPDRESPWGGWVLVCVFGTGRSQQGEPRFILVFVCVMEGEWGGGG